MNKNKAFKIFVLPIIVVMCFVLIVAFFLMHTSAYEAAENMIQSNSIVTANLGEIQGQRLSLFSGPSSFSADSSEGCAEFTVKVRGTRESGLVHISLEKIDGVWVANEARLALPNGNSVNLPIQRKNIPQVEKSRK